MNYDLAQVNVSRLLAPLDSTLLEPFVAALNEVNAEGDRAPGFVWRLQTESGNATDVEGFGWDDPTRRSPPRAFSRAGTQMTNEHTAAKPSRAG